MVLKIGIIGANGFIGSNLMRLLKGTAIPREGSDDFYDVIINANGNSNKRLADEKPLLDFDSSVVSVLRYVNSLKFDTYIHISSCEVYGDLTGDTQEESNLKPKSRYGVNKFLAEKIVETYCNKWLMLRLNGPIGPGMKKGPVYDIMNLGKIWLSPESKFQFLHLRYVSKFIELALNKKIKNETFNLTGSDSISLGDVTCLFNKVVEYPKEPVINHSISIKKANQVLLMPSSLESLLEVKNET